MNQNTLDRLKNNPHYKISPKQYAESVEQDRPPMIEIGTIQRNDATFEKHEVTIKKIKRTGKNAQ